jgi:hypothetical protein
MPMHLERMYIQGKIGLDCVPISGFRSCCGPLGSDPSINKGSALRICLVLTVGHRPNPQSLQIMSANSVRSFERKT